MARPFRHQPPSLPQATVVRPRLLAQVAQRWDRRLVTVVAGPGFGKTTLIVAAMTADASERRGRDVWLSCEPADESEEHLTAGLLGALGLPPEAGIEAVMDAVWARAPEPVCLIVDDAHEVPAGSAGALLLERVLADLPGNGHLLVASRDTVPVPTARLAASGQLVRVREDDLVLDEEEVEAFASARGVDAGLLASTGGWPALAELIASAGADLVIDYLWEEVLARVGRERARALARFAITGGGDDEVAAALEGTPVRADDLVEGVPLVQRSGTGWAALHPLWTPVLRRLITDHEALEARRRAAAVHRRRARYEIAVDLLVEAEAWDDVLEVLRDAEMHLVAPVLPAELGRWYRMLPPARRQAPAALLAAGLERQARAPLEAVATFEEAAAGFGAEDDIDGEAAAVAQAGLVRWWANDLPALVALIERAEVLASRGSPLARTLTTIGVAGSAHLAGDSEQVLSALAEVGDDLPGDWPVVVHWLRSVAHRRDGDLRRAHDALDAVSDLPAGRFALTVRHARLLVEWLEGRVDEVRAGLDDYRAWREREGAQYIVREATLELAGKTAWLGDADTARALLADAETRVPGMPSPLARVLRLVAAAALAIHEGDEAGARDLLRAEVTAALAGAERWYWRDRAAIALVHVLVPEVRAELADEPLTPVQLPGLRLAEALEAARAGDLAIVKSLEWPEAGVVRAHLPVRWVVELAAAGRAGANPPPEGLLDAVGPQLHEQVRAVIDTHHAAPVVTAARDLAAELPAVPPYSLRIAVLGPLELHRADEPVTDPMLRRQRVRDLLCALVVTRRARRAAIADLLWPELDDGGRNLRVTLSYLQRVLQPDRADREPPFFLRADGTWLALTGDDHLTVDAWELDARLDAADVAERTGAPATALAAYRAALPLWRGEPFADVVDAPWADVERTRLRARYVDAAVRAGHLLLAAGDAADARAAAARAITADPWAEPAYRLLVEACLAGDDPAGARRALDRCRAALAELDLEPEAATVALLAAAPGR